MKNIFYKLITGCFLAFVLTFSFAYAVGPAIGLSEAVANVTAGTDDQTNATTATATNVAEVKATRTLDASAGPNSTETLTIGLCVVTFTATAGSTFDELDCADNAATIDVDVGAGDVERTLEELAGALRTVYGVSDTGHGVLTVGGSSATATFTTTNTETTATAITYDPGTATAIESTSSTTGVIPVVQVNTITALGTVEAGDVFTATLPTVGAVTYTVTGSDTTTNDIATGLNAAIQASAGYAAQDFTSAASTNTVVLTAKVAGTGFTQTSSATDRGVAQVVVFTPTNLVAGWTLTITINDTDYDYIQQSGDTTQTVVEALQTLVTADAAVSCTEDDIEITCTASVTGTAFTYASGVTGPPTSSSNAISYGCTDENATNYSAFVRSNPSLCIYNNTATETVTTDNVSYIPTTFTSGSGLSLLRNRLTRIGNNGEYVMELQRILNENGNVLSVDGIFGPLTKGAVVNFQKISNLVPDGIVGPLTLGVMESLL